MSHIEILALSLRLAIKVLPSSVYSKGGKTRKRKQGRHDAEKKRGQTRHKIVKREKEKKKKVKTLHAHTIQPKLLPTNILMVLRNKRRRGGSVGATRK